MKKMMKKVESSEFVFDPAKQMDFRDLWIAMDFNPEKTWDFVMSRMIDLDIDTPPEAVEEIQCDSYEQLIEIFRRNLKFWPQKNCDALAVAIACTVSIRIKGPLLWMYLIGPSGCGKTTICEALGADRVHTLCKDQVTSLHSGWKPTKDENGKATSEDVSLIAKLRNKSLIIKDFTSLLSQSPQQQEKLYGELRHAYDGVARTHYANEVEHEYEKINFPLVAGVTKKIHGIKKSALGERFIKVDMSSTHWGDLLTACVDNVANSATSSVADPALSESVDEQHLHTPALKGATLGFMRFLFQKLSTGVPIVLPGWFRYNLAALAKVVAAGRADVEYAPGREKELAYRPALEVGSHVAGQLTKLAVCLAVVLDRQPDAEVFRIVKKVAWDTSEGFTFDVIRALANAPLGVGMTQNQIARSARVSKYLAGSALRDLMELGVVDKDTQEFLPPDEVDGRTDGVYFLSRDIKDAWDQVESSGVQAPVMPEFQPPAPIVPRMKKG